MENGLTPLEQIDAILDPVKRIQLKCIEGIFRILVDTVSFEFTENNGENLPLILDKLIDLSKTVSKLIADKETLQ